VDENHNTGVPHVSVILEESGIVTQADEEGRFTFFVPPGTFTVRAKVDEYREKSQVSGKLIFIRP
jgi:hypothetical protein